MAATADAYQAWPASPTPATGTASSPSVSRPEGLPGQQIQGGECAVKVGTLVSRRGDLTSINGGQDGCQPVSRLAEWWLTKSTSVTLTGRSPTPVPPQRPPNRPPGRPSPPRGGGGPGTCAGHGQERRSQPASRLHRRSQQARRRSPVA